MVQINLITMDSCGACHHFLDDEWKGTGGLDEILREKGFDVVHHNLNSNKRAEWKNRNPKLAPYVAWYPELIAIKDNGSVSVFALIKENGVNKYDDSVPLDKKSVLNWTLTL